MLLNKGDADHEMEVREYIEPGAWRDAFSGETHTVSDVLAAQVPAHGVRVYFFDGAVTRGDTRARLASLMAHAPRD